MNDLSSLSLKYFSINLSINLQYYNVVRNITLLVKKAESILSQIANYVNHQKDSNLHIVHSIYFSDVHHERKAVQKIQVQL
jgi:hypothetical protein